MYLPHLQGVRSLCAAWVLCGRFLPEENAGIWRVGQKRLDVAEDIFVVLSGFVAQWHAPHEVREVCSFYVRRLVRLLPAFWLAMAWSLIFQLPSLRCIFLLQWSKTEARQCPNGATATVAMLIPCRLIYPWTSSPLWKVGPRLTLGLAAAFWLLVTFLRGELDNPITSLASFGLGVAAARVAQEVFPDLEVETEDVGAKSQSWIWGSVADILAVLAALMVAFVGDRSGETQAFLAMERCMGLLAAMYFLFSSAGKSGHGLVQAVLSHASLASLGKYTLYVYLFQEPLFRSIDMLVPLKHSAEGFVFFVLLLWLIAGLYAENVEPLLLQMVYMHSPESRDELS